MPTLAYIFCKAPYLPKLVQNFLLPWDHTCPNVSYVPLLAPLQIPLHDTYPPLMTHTHLSQYISPSTTAFYETLRLWWHHIYLSRRSYSPLTTTISTSYSINIPHIIIISAFYDNYICLSGTYSQFMVNKLTFHYTYPHSMVHNLLLWHIFSFHDTYPHVTAHICLLLQINSPLLEHLYPQMAQNKSTALIMAKLH